MRTLRERCGSCSNFKWSGRLDLIEKVTLEQRLERGEAVCQGQAEARLLQAEAPAKVVVLRQEYAWCIFRTASEPGRMKWSGGQVEE